MDQTMPENMDKDMREDWTKMSDDPDNVCTQCYRVFENEAFPMPDTCKFLWSETSPCIMDAVIRQSRCAVMTRSRYRPHQDCPRWKLRVQSPPSGTSYKS